MRTIGTTSIENFSRRALRRFFISARSCVSSIGTHGFSGVDIHEEAGVERELLVQEDGVAGVLGRVTVRDEPLCPSSE